MRIYETLFFPPHFERDALWSKGKLDLKFSFFKKKIYLTYVSCKYGIPHDALMYDYQGLIYMSLQAVFFFFLVKDPKHPFLQSQCHHIFITIDKVTNFASNRPYSLPPPL